MIEPTDARFDDLKNKAVAHLEAVDLEGMTEDEQTLFLAFLCNACLLCMNINAGADFTKAFLQGAAHQLQQPDPFILPTVN